MNKRLSVLLAAALAAASSVRGEALEPTLFAWRVPFAASGYAGSEPLTNFPVLVRLAAGFDYAACAPDGSDLRFADAEGNLLPHEIDTWSTNGTSLVWVGIPVLTNGTAFALYYGSDDPGAASPANLWSLAGYAGVWHLSDGRDSTTNGLDGALVSGISAAADSRLGGALDFADAKMSVGTTPNGDLASGFSIEAWCYPRRLTDKTGDSSKNGNAFFGKDAALSVRVQGSRIRLTTPGVKDHDFADCSIATNEWFHLGLTFKPNPATSGTGTVANQYKVYRDGEPKASLGASRIPNLSSNAVMWLGGNQWDSQSFDGILDEVRLSYSIRSPDWIQACYDTAAAPASFAVAGTVERMDPTAPRLGSPSVAAADGSFVVTAVVSRNVPASIACTIDGTDYEMEPSGESLPRMYSAVVSNLPAGTHTASVRATSTGGTVVVADCPAAFHAGALAVSTLSDADEGTLSPGVFRVSRADVDPTGLPALSFDVAFSGEGLAAVAPPGIASAAIPAGAAYVDIPVTPVYAPAVAADATLAIAVSGALVGAPSSGSLVVVNTPYDPAVRYVATTGDDANHGGTPELPKATIAAAVASFPAAVRAAPCTVHVAPGTYTLSRDYDDPISVTNAIRIVGDGGTPEDVVVRRTERAGANSSAYRSWQDCSIFHLDHPGALVANLVLQYGSAHQAKENMTAGNAWIGANGGTISNCVVRNGSATHPYAVSAGILMTGPGLVTHCIITNNATGGSMETSWSGSTLGSAVVMRGAGGRLENCLVRDNRSAADKDNDRTSAVCAEGSATIANCTIVENQGRVCGGVYANGTGVTIRNCVIAGNADIGVDSNDPNWRGSGAFVACATDDAAAIDEGCIAGALDEFFPRLADGGAPGIRYRPGPGSPLLDAGADYGPMAAFDLSGRQPRRVGAAVDIGCYEDAYLSVEATGSPTIGLTSFATDLSLGTESLADVAIVWSADASFADASTNAVAEGATNGVYGASIGGLEPDAAYWWKLVADDGRIRVETPPASFRTPGAPTFGAVAETVAGPTARFSVELASLARDELGNGLRTYVSVHYTTNGTDYAARSLGFATRARTFAGSETLPNGDYTWYARAWADYGGRTIEARTAPRTFRVFHNAAPPSGFHRLDATIAYEGEAAVDIPVLLRLSEEIEGFRYADVANNGKDFLLSDQDGNLLPFEIDVWNPAGESLVWVRAPVFENGAVIHVDYGASEADGTADAADVWRRYVGVWHLDATNAASAYGSYPNSTAVAGIDGEKAKASIAGHSGRFGRSVRICGAGWKEEGYSRGGVFVPDAGENSPLDLGSAFMVSGWFRHADQRFHYDKLFGKRRSMDNSGSPDGAFAIQMDGESSTQRIGIQGGGSSSVKATPPASFRDVWSHLAFVFDGAVCRVYQDGAPCAASGSVNPATDNDAPLGFGNLAGGRGDGAGDCAWCGWIDEVRLADGVPTDAWLAAEHAAMASGTNVVRFAAARYLEMPVLAGPPSLAWTGGSFRSSAPVAYGLGTVLLATVDLLDGSATTNATHAFESTASLPQSIAADVALGENRMYRAVAVLRSSDGAEECLAAAGEAVYSGTISAEWRQDADIADMRPAVVRLSRADTEAATCAPLAVAVSLSGEAFSKGLLEPLASATIPAGASYVDAEIRPVARSVDPRDYRATLTVAGTNVADPGASAPFRVLHAGADPYVRFVATDGDDENNDGALASRPKRTIAAAIASFSDAARAAPCTVHVAPGTYTLARDGDAPIAVTNAIRIVGGGATPEDVVVRRDARAGHAHQDCSIFHLDHPGALVGNLVVEDGSVYQPKEHTTAGGAWIGPSGGTISNCIVRGGYACHPYGVTSGILVEGPGLVTHCIVTNNVCDSGMEQDWTRGELANAVVMRGAGSRLENCLIRDNRSATDRNDDKTSAVYARSTATIANCTIVGNRGRVCGGVFADGGGVTVRNCAIAGNADVGVDAGDPNWMGTGAFVACATDDAEPASARCVAGPPAALFRNPAAGDFRPRTGGPLVGAGVNYEPMAGVDLSGVQPRRIDARVDIGCYEAFSETSILILR